MVTPKMPKNVEEKTKKFIRGKDGEDIWRFSVTLDKSDYDDLRALADDERRSVSRQAELCIINALKERKRAAEQFQKTHS